VASSAKRSTVKRKGGIPLDELFVAVASGDDARLSSLLGRYGGSVVPASTIASKVVDGAETAKNDPNKAQERVWLGRMAPR